MKMVKSLLLGSAAGMVAVAGAQAADLPVKAKPVEYVKICSLYGDGFYYIPGTDTCIKIAGLIWAEFSWNHQGGNENPAWTTIAGARDRSISQYNSRARDDLDLDARTQTAFGTLRSFGRFRAEVTSGQPGVVATGQTGTTAPVVGTGASSTNEGGIALQAPRAFVQWAGFTFGRVKSFSDPVANCADWRLLQGCQVAADTTGGGNNEFTYTWEIGNGMTFNFGFADRRVDPVTNLSNPGVVSVGAGPTSSVSGVQTPMFLANFRVAQAWGTASASFVANDNTATYYSNTNFVGAPAACTAAAGGTTVCGHPNDKWGFAGNASAMINVPFISQGDRIGLGFQYAVGATKLGAGNVASPGLFGGGNNVAVGSSTDAVFVNGGQLELTTSWSFQGGFEHWFTPQWSFVLYGAYAEVNYNSRVVNNGWFCGQNGGNVAQNIMLATGAATAVGACNPSFSFFQVLGTLSWYVAPNFRLAGEVAYTQVNTAYNNQAITLTKAQGLRPVGAYQANDQGIVSFIFRAQRTWGNNIGG